MKYLTLALAALTVLATSYSADAAYVRGYYKPSTGTYVQPYTRSKADGNPYNNYGY